MEIGYYCPDCNKIYSSCWELQGVMICTNEECFSEGKIKLITLDNLRDHLRVIPFRLDALEVVQEMFKRKTIQQFTEKEREKIILILNKGLRREKLEKIQEIIDNKLTSEK